MPIFDPPNPEAAIRDWIFRFFRFLAEDKFDHAVAMFDVAVYDKGKFWTAEFLRYIIEDLNFGPDTLYRVRHPEGVVYSDPDSIGESPELYLHQYDDGSGFLLEVSFPLNGEWCELFARVEFLWQEKSLMARLHDVLVP